MKITSVTGSLLKDSIKFNKVLLFYKNTQSSVPIKIIANKNNFCCVRKASSKQPLTQTQFLCTVCNCVLLQQNRTKSLSVK